MRERKREGNDKRWKAKGKSFRPGKLRQPHNIYVIALAMKKLIEARTRILGLKEQRRLTGGSILRND